MMGKDKLIVSMYVDDLIVTNTRVEDIDGFKGEMAARFCRSDLGWLSYYLGIEVKPGSSSISLCQHTYAELLDQSGMAGCKPCTIPMEEQLKLPKDNTTEKMNTTMYQSIIGGLRYLTHATEHRVRGWLREQIHGGPAGRPLGCSEAAAALCQRDGRPGRPLPQDRRNWAAAQEFQRAFSPSHSGVFDSLS
jgi:hypothetical protein